MRRCITKHELQTFVSSGELTTCLKSGSSLCLLFKLSKFYPSWFCSLVFFALGVCGLCGCVCFVSFLGQFSGLTSAVRGFGRIAQSCKHLTLTRFKMRLANLCLNEVLLTYVLILWKMRLVNEFDEENGEPDQQHQEHWEFADEFLFVSYYSTRSHDFYLVSLPLVFFFFLFIEATMLGIKAVNSVYSLPLLDMWCCYFDASALCEPFICSAPL